MVFLTRQAAEHIRFMKNGKKYVRVKAADEEDKGYKVEFTDEVNEDDILYISYGIKILVGSATRRYFENLKVDYMGKNGNGEFVFQQAEGFGYDY